MYNKNKNKIDINSRIDEIAYICYTTMNTQNRFDRLVIYTLFLFLLIVHVYVYKLHVVWTTFVSYSSSFVFVIVTIVMFAVFFGRYTRNCFFNGDADIIYYNILCQSNYICCIALHCIRQFEIQKQKETNMRKKHAEYLSLKSLNNINKTNNLKRTSGEVNKKINQLYIIYIFKQNLCFQRSIISSKQSE